ncbi:cation diffusion facilitator family transporter [Neisseria wadsworthii]|uniref:cation diffusion facilitator family transporter n=1 Tax=Neisseria wadsworthii TaxID=607711 RepID=UPI000D2FF451|nr:cation diffusion facilitator family transporter [Neisseria wadsworthii]
MSASHEHHHSHTANKQVLRTSLIVIGVFMLIEVIGGMVTNSLALLSDAGHMLSDALSLGISLLAMKLGERSVNRYKTFGYKRFEILAAAFNGLTLLVISLLIAWEAIGRFIQPPPVSTTGMLVVSTLGLLVNVWVAWYMLKNSDTEENLNMKSAYLHVLSDLFGSLGAIAAALLMMAFGWQWADPLASMLVAALIARSGWGVMQRASHILMEGVPVDVDLDHISGIIRQTEGVDSVHDLHVWSISNGIHALSCHIVVEGGMSVTEAEQIVYRLEHSLAHENIQHVTVQTESRVHPHGDDLLCKMPIHEHHEHHHQH